MAAISGRISWRIPVCKSNGRPRAAPFGQEPEEFVADSFHADLPEGTGELGDRCQSFRIDIETEGAGEPDGPHDPQLILLEAIPGRAGRPDKASFEVGLAPHEIQDAVTFGVEKKCVDGEVPAQRVLAGIGELDLVRMPAVVVAGLLPERCYLVLVEA